MDKQKIKKFGFEFLTIFIGVFAAFALDNWNDNRKDNNTELKILSEINSGLKQDIKDINTNEEGHKQGILAVIFFNKLILNKQTSSDSLTYPLMAQVSQRINNSKSGARMRRVKRAQASCA